MLQLEGQLVPPQAGNIAQHGVCWQDKGKPHIGALGLISPLRDVLKSLRFRDAWWLVVCATDFFDKASGFESGISHKDPGVLQDHCVLL